MPACKDGRIGKCRTDFIMDLQANKDEAVYGGHETPARECRTCVIGKESMGRKILG